MKKQNYIQPGIELISCELNVLMEASQEGFVVDNFEDDGTF